MQAEAAGDAVLALDARQYMQFIDSLQLGVCCPGWQEVPATSRNNTKAV